MSMKDLILSMMLEQLEEKATNPYAIGMAAAMKSTGDEPPLEKSTIKKAHKIAKGIEKNEEVELDEQIKGWKHAGSDISKWRSAQGKDVKLVRLKKDGAENKMHDATKMFRSEDEAQQHHDRVTELNPKSKIAHNLYVNGKLVKKLGEEVEQIDEISQEKLGSYYDAAAKDRKKAKAEVEKGMTQKKFTPASVQKTTDAYKRFIKRGKGMTAAANKMDENKEY